MKQLIVIFLLIMTLNVSAHNRADTSVVLTPSIQFTNGTYTPTFSAVGGSWVITAPETFGYTRSGDMVTVTGSVVCNNSVGTQAIEFNMSLPIASNFTNQRQAGGGGVGQLGLTLAPLSLYIASDATNDNAYCQSYNLGVTGIVFNVSFTYKVL